MNLFKQIFMRTNFYLIIIFIRFWYSLGAAEEGIFKLPELIVYSNRSYLVRGVETKLECRISGQPIEWLNATLDRLIWLKDGAPINEDESTSTQKEYNFGFEKQTNSFGKILRIIQASHHNEGEYQCSAIVRQINIAPNLTIDTRLVSAPLKLKRARITKFERYDSFVVRVRQGQVSRLACQGIPDVIPGPPELWFEKYGHEGLELGRTGNERFIVTTSGLQIALTQPSDAGRYFCIVRNSFTNQTRRAPRPIILVVDSHEFNSKGSLHKNLIRQPQIFFPESKNYSQSIEVHAVVGQTIILECVIWEAKVVWNRSNAPMGAVSLTDDWARIRQIWGNLRIKHVTMEDSGDYICYGISPLMIAPNLGQINTNLFEANDSSKFTRVKYRLIVHAPTNVRLILTQQTSDKSWKLNCYANNLRYEIPMVYVNGLALIDAMGEMGVSPQTNFFTNPINVTLRANNPLTGSVQCVSRPAMEEAEIYGNGLERGRAMNLYVADHITIIKSNQNTKNYEQRIIIQKEVEVGSIEDQILIETQNIQIQRPMAFVADDNSVRIQWSVEPKFHPKLSHIQSFAIEMLQNEPNDIAKSKWKMIDYVQPHVRALTLRKLTIKSKYEFKLRVTANFDDRSRLSSEPTDWLKTQNLENNNSDKEIDNNNKNERNSAPLPPFITRLQTVSHESMLVSWNHSAVMKFPHQDSVAKFIIIYEALDYDYFEVQKNQKLKQQKQQILGSTENNKNQINKFNQQNDESNEFAQGAKSIEVDVKSTEILLIDLEPDTEYKVTVIAVDYGKRRSLPSRPRVARTYVLIDELYKNGKSIWWTKLRSNYLNLPDISLKFELMFGAFCIAAIILVILCCLTAIKLCECRGRNRRNRRGGSSIDSANQFFMETSSPTFSSPGSSSHRISKRDQQLYHEPRFFTAKNPISELSPLGYYENSADDELSPDNLKLEQNQKKFKDNNDTEYISRKALLAAIVEKNNTIENVTLENTVKRPNLYGNPDAQLDELLDDIYGSMIVKPIMNGAGSVPRSATITRSSTLKRASSLQRQKISIISKDTNLIDSNNNISNELTLNRRTDNSNFILKAKSPSPLSTSLYGGIGFDMTPSRRLLLQQSTTETQMNNGFSQLLLTTENTNKNEFSFPKQLDTQNRNPMYTSEHIKSDWTQFAQSPNYHRPVSQLTYNNNKFNLQKSSQILNSNELGENNLQNSNNNEIANSICSSRISLSNCGCSTVAYGDFPSITPTNNFDFDNCAINGDNLSMPSLNLLHHSSINNASAPATNSISTFSTNNQMSTFKSSPPAPHSANSFSSGYNSYLGSGIAISINGNNNGNIFFDNTNLSECSSSGGGQNNHFQLSYGTTNEGYISGSPILNGNNN